MAVNISIQEVGGNVVWTSTGTLNVAGLTYNSTTTGGSGFDATNAVFGSGIGASADVYTGSITKPANFGTGGAGAASATGSYLSIQGIPAALWVPAGYTSGAAISNTTTYTGSFASLGLTPGTYTYSWGSGGNADSMTLTIGAPAVTPTPTVTSTPTPTSTPAPVSSTIQITSNNYSGQIADITFYPCSGGTISLGEQTIPYSYESTYYYGLYSLYFSAYNSTCTYDIVCPSPTPTSTTTPTVTPTNTPTPTIGGEGWFFYYANNTVIASPPSNNGNTAFIPGGGLGTYNPNYTGGTLSLFFNKNNSAGTSYESQFSGLDTSGGTITISQGSSVAIYSGTSTDYNLPPTYLQLIVSNSAQMIQSASTPFVSGTTINVVVS
jgi:hypothetical protein